MASVDILKDEPMKVNLVDKARARAHISDELARAVLAEFFCTAFLLFGGGCVNVQYVLAPRNEKSIKWIDVTIGWGLSLFFAVCIGHRISGAHLNPAVSLFQLTQGKISPIRFIIFAMAQNVGAFIGSFICFLVYYDAINLYDGGIRQVTGPNATAGIFATYPSPNLSILGGCVDQVVGTAVLCIGIASIVDKRNRIPPFMQPAFIGLILVLIGMALGSNCGYAVNPARDFGPRLFTLAVGYGWEVFTYDEYRWFWIPIICPMFGAVAGAWMYEAFIGFHMPDEPETINDSSSEGYTNSLRSTNSNTPRRRARDANFSV
ncbi:hypothetical protein PFISCL1PPCAC_845 [Pristionchus fissidentatus]|uniref:Aquaglyceroporin-3 n=1 Tax=Pristionchus fissidentatus TaxID=1538716 RepID=A0AAV5UTI0_9BILA|nr:hypothetical protein PFISCL1PPCAC_845 [Pristionchus fissidentatus]